MFLTCMLLVHVVKTGTGTVGHLPKKISTPCHLFLRKGGTTYFMYNHQ